MAVPGAFGRHRGVHSACLARLAQLRAGACPRLLWGRLQAVLWPRVRARARTRASRLGEPRACRLAAAAARLLLGTLGPTPKRYRVKRPCYELVYLSSAP